MTTSERRADIDRQRTKISQLIQKLESDLEADGHSLDDCPMSCFTQWCDDPHHCPVCEEDGE